MMARSKQKHVIPPQTLFGLLVVLGAGWLLIQVLQNLPPGSGSAIGLIFLLIFACAAAYPVVLLLRRTFSQQALLQKAKAMTDQQLEPLLRRRAQLVRLDAYGKPQRDKWVKEIDYFISQHIQPSLTRGELTALKRNYREVSEIIGNKVEATHRERPAFRSFSDSMTPVEFETFCAEELRRAGWDARVTMQSRDQGVDVIAEKDGRRVVFQCKLYSRPVGNKSVQEVVAARAHEQADFGVVVSNSRYT
ncbi:MAG: restriction endonuclease, partial [Acetobacteraceae bacterium]|nr:restriction endonuclease [Acetobacteraceae bacterium]